jgi:hypothetical protein
MERESTDPGGCDVERDQPVGEREIQPRFLRCAVCHFPLGILVCELDREPRKKGWPMVGIKDLDGTGLTAWVVCDECVVLAERSFNIVRRADGCLEPGGDWVSGDGDVRSSVAQVDQPANVVEASSDSDGCGRSGGCGCGEVEEADQCHAWISAPPAAEG